MLANKQGESPAPDVRTKISKFFGSTTHQILVDTNYTSRLIKSKLLVIGASYSDNENSRFEPIDPNYIAVGCNFGCETSVLNNPLNEHWETQDFWKNLNKKLNNHKFTHIIIDVGTFHHALQTEKGSYDFVNYILTASANNCKFYCPVFGSFNNRTLVTTSFLERYPQIVEILQKHNFKYKEKEFLFGEEFNLFEK